MVAAIQELSQVMSVAEACQAMELPRSTYYQRTAVSLKQAGNTQAKLITGRALDSVEREQIHGLLNSERFVDCSPYTIYATLLDEGEYLCSISTMYRVLREQQEVQ